MIHDMARKSPVERAAKSMGKGGKSELARRLGITYQSIQQWELIPAKRVAEVEKITGIPRYELRPDLYPKEREAA